MARSVRNIWWNVARAFEPTVWSDEAPVSGVEVAKETLLDENAFVFQLIVAVVNEVGVATMLEIIGG